MLQSSDVLILFQAEVFVSFHELNDSNLVLEIDMVHDASPFNGIHHLGLLLIASLHLCHLSIELSFHLCLLNDDFLDLVTTLGDFIRLVNQ